MGRECDNDVPFDGCSLSGFLKRRRLYMSVPRRSSGLMWGARRNLHGSAARGFPKALRLQVEGLEDRCLLSTFSVLNTADSGAGSLRQAITDANSTANVG